MGYLTTCFCRRSNVSPMIAACLVLLTLPSQACEADEMVAQMRTACNEMVAGYQKTVGKPFAGSAAQGFLLKAKAHCQALEFDKAGITLAMASRPMTPLK